MTDQTVNPNPEHPDHVGPESPVDPPLNPNPNPTTDDDELDENGNPRTRR